MKKVIRFIKRNCVYMVLAVVGAAVLNVVYLVLHQIATVHRDYEAIGGEIFVFLVPYLIYVMIKNIKDTKEAYKNR